MNEPPIKFELIDIPDYQAAMRKPSRAFADDELKEMTVAKNSLGWPAANTGGFAAVYKLSGRGNRALAVRCFVQLAPDLADRYANISTHLAGAVPKQDRQYQFFVQTRYIPQGIHIESGWKPITTMPWIEGEPLDVYLDRAVREPYRLPRLLAQIDALERTLRRVEIAHGDLGHRNILIDPSGALRLIDYDGMWVPALQGRISNEKGLRDYQHPGRTWEHYGQGMDRFSLIVLYLTVLAVERHPEVWQANARSEGLLLRGEDFLAPDESPMLKSLAEYDDLAPYVRRFRRICVEPITDVPSLADFVLDLTERPAAVGPEETARANDLVSRPDVTVERLRPPLPTTSSIPSVKAARSTLDRYVGQYVTITGRYVRFEKGDSASGPYRVLFVQGQDDLEIELVADPVVVRQVRSTGRSWKVTRGQELRATGLLLAEEGRYALQLEQAASLVRGARPPTRRAGPRPAEYDDFFRDLLEGEAFDDEEQP